MLRITYFFLLFSCSFLPLRDKERKIQTEIITTLNSRSTELSNCVKRNDLFSKLNKDRIRIVVYLTLNSKGLVEKFKLDDYPYPNNFAECIFQKIDSLNFPKLAEKEILELEQPFIFSKE